MEVQRYQVTQDNKEYILSNIVINDKIRIECQDNNYPSSQKYIREYSKNDLLSLSSIFNYTQTLFDVQNELNNTIERQEVRITNLGNMKEILFNLRINSFNEEITFQLFPIQNIQNISPPQNINQIQVINQPIYHEVNIPYNIATYEEDYPDCTYSTRAPQTYKTTQIETGCGCLLDQDRITKIELDSNLLKNEHDRLLQRLNNLKMNLKFIKKFSSNLRKENGILNMRTLELKKIYKDLLEAEAALMAENDELKREKHELILKKNELDFYIRDHHDHDIVREVNIPIEEKRRRPTNVSKTEKQNGGGYSSSSGKKGLQNQGYTSTMSNKVQGNTFRNNIQDFY